LFSITRSFLVLLDVLGDDTPQIPVKPDEGKVGGGDDVLARRLDESLYLRQDAVEAGDLRFSGAWIGWLSLPCIQYRSRHGPPSVLPAPFTGQAQTVTFPRPQFPVYWHRRFICSQDLQLWNDQIRRDVIGAGDLKRQELGGKRGLPRAVRSGDAVAMVMGGFVRHRYKHSYFESRDAKKQQG
jgi:hypothetical protein